MFKCFTKFFMLIGVWFAPCLSHAINFNGDEIQWEEHQRTKTIPYTSSLSPIESNDTTLLAVYGDNIMVFSSRYGFERLDTEPIYKMLDARQGVLKQITNPGDLSLRTSGITLSIADTFIRAGDISIFLNKL